jgi:hypothetical protein
MHVFSSLLYQFHGVAFLKRLLSQLLEYELQKHLIINFRQSYSTALK